MASVTVAGVFPGGKMCVDLERFFGEMQCKKNTHALLAC